MLYDVGLYFNFEGKMDVEKNGIPLTELDKVADPSMPHLDALKRAAYTLRRHHVPYSVISNSRPDLLENLKVLVLPDVPNMSKENMASVKNFVENGGKLYMSGHSAPDLLKEFFNLEWQGLMEDNICYIAPKDDYEPLTAQCTREHPLVLFEKAVKVTGEGKGKVLGTITLPFTLPNPHDTVSFHDPSLKITHSYWREPFASIHSNPPGIATEMPAMMQVQYGKGEVIWSALPIEKADRPQHSDLFADIVIGLAGPENMCFEAKAAESIECILFEDAEAGQKIMGIINLQESFHIMPAVDITVSVKSDGKPKEVYCVSAPSAEAKGTGTSIHSSAPVKEPVPYCYEDGKVAVFFQRIDYFKVLVIQY